MLTDFDVPEVTSDPIACGFFVSLCKFYHLLRLGRWSTVLEQIAVELMSIHLITKEMLFGMKICVYSSLDLS